MLYKIIRYGCAHTSAAEKMSIVVMHDDYIISAVMLVVHDRLSPKNIQLV